jgi:nucleoside-diphosphate-sugar epimerase
MTILIVGSRSMVGRRLHRRLSRTSVVKTAGRDESADVPFDLAVPFVPPANALTFDVVIHCAGSFGGDGLDDAVNNEIVNAVGSLRVAQLAQAVRCRHVISVNSLSICDHPENQYFGSYGLSKKHGHENLAWGCRTLGLEYTALLASQLYDEYGEARRHQPFLYHIVDRARAGTEVQLFGRVSPRRNFLFIEDLAAVVEGVIEKSVFGTYPVLSGESPTLVEVAETAFRVFGTTARIRQLIDKPDTPTIYLPADRSIYDRVGWNLTTNLESGLSLVRDCMRH